MLTKEQIEEWQGRISGIRLGTGYTPVDPDGHDASKRFVRAAFEALPLLLADREELIGLLRDEVLPVLQHAIDRYACGEALALRIRLAAALR